MDQTPKVKAVMTPFPYSITETATLEAAHKMMEEHQIHHLPVVRHGHLVGVISARDLSECERRRARDGVRDDGTVSQVPLESSCIVEMNHPLDEVLADMAQDRLGAVLVVKEDRLAGIFTASDACRLFADFLRRSFPSGDNAA